MNIILLSGGSGKRLWPLSNEVRSKQFLKVIKNENGIEESMLQRVYKQIRTIFDKENIIIACSNLQQESIKNQLGNDIAIVCEPERRDTFPAISLSVAYLHFIKNCDINEVTVVLPVDPYVENSYFEKIKSLETIICKNNCEIALMGAKPTYPSAKYGYIIPKISNYEPYDVLEFREKPSEEEAKKYIQRGALWNCGVFAFRIKYILEILKKYIKYLSFDDIYQQYSILNKISFDYEVVEKAKRVKAVVYNGEWKDLGTWNTLTEVMQCKEQGNVILDESSVDSHVINELDIPIVAMGVKNIVIAASPDGILVSDKEQSSYLKKYTDKIMQRPMFEEREWGEYKVLDLLEGDDKVKCLTKRKVIKKCECIKYQLHKNRSEVWIILNGRCIIMLNDKEIEAKVGDTFVISIGMKHGLKAITMVDLLEVQIGVELLEDGTEIIIE